MTPQKDRGVFHIIFPGVLEAIIPLNTVMNIDQAINTLGYVKKVVCERNGDILASSNPDLKESDLLSLDDLGWSDA